MSVTQPSKAVFLSYASQDAAAARSICEALSRGGVEVWFDQSELRGGDAWDQRIRQQIQDCALFIPVISANTQRRQEGYFRLEWRLADQRTHLMSRNKTFIVPVAIDATADSGAPDSFSIVQWTRLPSGATPPAFVARIQQLLTQHADLATASSPTAAEPANGFALRAEGSGTRARWLVPLVVVLAVIGAGYVLVNKFVLKQPPAVAQSPVAATESGAKATSATATPSKLNSIAVLPFLDMSEKKDQEYFSDGLSEELIDLLAKTQGLEVIARTSSFYFKGRQATIAEIAKTLNVANIIEGSVRKSGNTLRVTAQLIRASDGVHLWSETYDRNLKDVFQVQDDIARGVVDKLKLTLLPPAADSAARTQNVEAHNLYLQGRYFVTRDTPEDLTKALDLFQRSRTLDPSYAPAWAGEGTVAFRRVANSVQTLREGFDAARAAASKALQLDPDSSEGCNVLANALVMKLKWPEADAVLAKCHAANSDQSDLLLTLAALARQLGRDEESVSLFHLALEHDPLNPFARRYFARTLWQSGQWKQAETVIRQLLEINAGQPGAQYQLGVILLSEGDPAAALAAFEAEPAPGWKDYGLALGYGAMRRGAQADAALGRMLQTAEGAQFQIAETYAYRGSADAAFKWLDAAIDHDFGLLWLRGDPLLSPLTKDPRYGEFLRKINLPQ
jgi:TolB-like protein/cytochrome c-type biogenesis protein CcmH/NrfG